LVPGRECGVGMGRDYLCSLFLFGDGFFLLVKFSQLAFFQNVFVFPSHHFKKIWGGGGGEDKSKFLYLVLTCT